MSNVIKFPRAEERKHLETTPEPSMDKMYMGSFTFTCSCGETGIFEPKNMIFRSMELYCAKCGVPHKLVNPAFYSQKPSRPR